MDRVTTTPDDEKDCAQTPNWLVRAIEEHFKIRFGLDVCALKASAKAPNYYSLVEGIDGLTTPWHLFNWCNPPYSDIMPWAKKAVYQSILGKTSVLLIPDKPEVKYYRFCNEFADTIVHMPFRVNFLRPSSEDFLDRNGKKQGPKFPVCVVLFTPWGIRMPTRSVYFDYRTLR